MNDTELERSLKSVGYECFVFNYDIFSDFNLSLSERRRKLKSARNYSDSGIRTRVSRSNAIIVAGRATDAMTIVANSRKTDPRAIAAAKAWLAAR